MVGRVDLGLIGNSLRLKRTTTLSRVLLMYDLYKPLRNYLRRVSLIQSLGVIRAYLQYLQFGQPFPRDVQVHLEFFRAPRPANGVYEWDLAILAKELILNAPEIGEYDFRTWDVLANALNKLKDLENGIGNCYDKLFEKNILLGTV